MGSSKSNFCPLVFLQLTSFPYLGIFSHNAIFHRTGHRFYINAFSLTMFHRTGHRFYIYEFSLRMFHRTGHRFYIYAFSLRMFHRTGHRFYIYAFSLRMFHRTGHQGGAAPPPYSQTQNYDPISKY